MVLPESPGLCFINWRNVFVVIDDGTSAPADYQPAEDALQRHATLYPRNMGCLIVIPHGARPPSERARATVNTLLDRHSDSFFGLAWVVEGRGFNSAMVRAALTAMGLARRRPHASYVSSSIDDSLSWLLTRKRNTSSPTELAAGLRAVETARSMRPAQTYAV
jgi:hypothetical protein